MILGVFCGICIFGFELYVVNDDEGLLVIGWVVVGVLIFVEQNIEEFCWINFVFFNFCVDYLLCVCGMSMKDIGIFDGDLLVVYVICEVCNGQVVVVWIGEEVMVKCFKCEGSKVWLLVENFEFVLIEVDLKEQELIIEGLSVGVIWC